MLPNNADDRRCSYFELGLPVLDRAETAGNRLPNSSKAVPACGVATCSSFENVDAAVGLCSTSETSCWMWLIAVLAMDWIEAGSLLEWFEDAMFVSESTWQELCRKGLWDICQNYEKIIMTNKKLILEWKKLNYHYIMRSVRQNQLIMKKK